MTTAWTPTARPDLEELRTATQKDRVREILRSANRDGVCSLFLYAIGIPNGRTRVYSLRDDDGLAIETLPCKASLYHRGEHVPNHVRFVWRWNQKASQLALIHDVDES